MKLAGATGAALLCACAWRGRHRGGGANRSGLLPARARREARRRLLRRQAAGARALRVPGPAASRRGGQGRPRRQRAPGAPMGQARPRSRQGARAAVGRSPWRPRRPRRRHLRVARGPAGHQGARLGRFEFHDHVFPVVGPHSYGDVFGAPRSGGRVHEGQDLPSPCGTPLIAARGGRVQATGYSDALYGYYVLIDGLATHRDYFYAHMEAPTPLSEGERVRTGARIGRVGKTGNAARRVLPAALRAVATRLPRRVARRPGSGPAGLGFLLLVRVAWPR